MLFNKNTVSDHNRRIKHSDDSDKVQKYVAIGLLTLIAQTALAGTQGTVDSAPNQPLYQPLVTFTAGPDFVQKGQTQQLSLLPPFQNLYTNDNSMTVADAGVFIGIERVVSDGLSVQLGLSGYGDAHISPEGHVWQFASPEFDTLTYTYNVHHTRIMAEGKVLSTVNPYQALHPYISWELGVAINQASNYHETPLISGADPTLPFANNTQTSLVWGAGAGIDYAINSHIRLGAGYQFADLGSVSSGQTLAATTTQTLNLSHLYTSQLRFQLTFLV